MVGFLADSCRVLESSSDIQQEQRPVQLGRQVKERYTAADRTMGVEVEEEQ